MTIVKIPPSQSRRLLPLLHQVHDLHLMHQPDRYAPLPEDRDMIAHLQTWLSQHDIHALGFEKGGALLGYTIIEIENRDATPFRASETRAMVHHICVDSEQRRQGIGLALLEAARNMLHEAGGQVLATTYAEFNSASAGLMERAGLRPVVRFAEWRSDN